jgi:hypothetical protein
MHCKDGKSLYMRMEEHVHTHIWYNACKEGPQSYNMRYFLELGLI